MGLLFRNILNNYLVNIGGILKVIINRFFEKFEVVGLVVV